MGFKIRTPYLGVNNPSLKVKGGVEVQGQMAAKSELCCGCNQKLC